MKKSFIFFLLAVSLTPFISNTFAQSATSISSLEAFMQKGGVKALAQFAHPFNTYTEGQYSIDGNNIKVWVSYSNGSTETLQLRYNLVGDYFDGVKCTAGDECLYSFMAIKTITSGFPQEDRSCLENFFHMSFKDMTGQQLAAAGITHYWWEWRGRSCN